jgi:cytochrome c oxidase subunit 6b
MPADMEIPLTFSQRLAKEPKGMTWAPNSDKWYDKAINEKLKEEMWAAPYDARFPQCKKQRMCFTYFVDYHRCKELKGEDYAPCQFFKNVYMDVCPRFWVDKWHEWIDEGKFPARFDR